MKKCLRCGCRILHPLHFIEFKSSNLEFPYHFRAYYCEQCWTLLMDILIKKFKDRVDLIPHSNLSEYKKRFR